MNQSDKKQLLEYCQKAKGKGLDKVYLHWTAGGYNAVFNDYHACIRGDGEVYFMTDNLAEVKNHTWKRNTNAIGISLCCAYNAQFPNKFGEYPPTNEQIETMAEMIAIISKELDIPIYKGNIMTHAEAALIDGYGAYSGDPETRWDLYQLKDFDNEWKPGGDILRGKALFYQNKIS